MGRPSVLLADDHTLVVEAFKKLLESDFEVVGAVSDGQSLLSIAPSLKPDVVVLDLSMPGLGGMEAGIQLKKLLPRSKVIVLTMSEDTDIASEALHRWASGYLIKKSAGSELIRAIWDALRGRSYVTQKIRQGLQEQFVRDPRPEHKKQLTYRQRQVLKLLAEGRTMKEVADTLHVTARTVAFHKYKIMDDFRLKTTSDLVKFAIREKVIYWAA